MKANRRGFTLLELLITVALLAIVAGAVLKFLHQGQQTFGSQSEINRANEKARVAMDLIVRYLRHAGNDPFGAMEAGGVPPARILSPNEILISSDITGSVASTTGNPKEATGDPDGQLSSIHEQVRFRFNGPSRELFMDIGYGETLLAADVMALQFEGYDLAGNPTLDSNSVARIKVRIVARTNRKSVARGKHDRVSIASDVFMRSKSYNPFESDLEGGSEAASPSGGPSQN